MGPHTDRVMEVVQGPRSMCQWVPLHTLAPCQWDPLHIQEWALSQCPLRKSILPTSQWFSTLRTPTPRPSTPVGSATRRSTTTTRQYCASRGVTSGSIESAPASKRQPSTSSLRRSMQNGCVTNVFPRKMFLSSNSSLEMHFPQQMQPWRMFLALIKWNTSIYPFLFGFKLTKFKFGIRSPY